MITFYFVVAAIFFALFFAAHRPKTAMTFLTQILLSLLWPATLLLLFFGWNKL